MSHRLLATLAALVALLMLAAPAAAHDPSRDQSERLSRIDLPNGWAPEGITAGRNGTAYVGSLADGAIAKVNTRSGAVSVLAAGAAGRVTVGLDYERHARRIWAAGGGTSDVHAFDARTGALLRTYHFTSGFLNDVVVTRRAVYVTDSNVQQLIVIPLPRDGSLPDASMAFTLPLTGDIAFTAGFNANGIVASGHSLILVQSNTGLLFRVNPRTGATRTIDTGGASVTFGDGLELHGKTLYVVRNQLNQVDVFKLRKHASAARFVKTITSPSLAIPTTTAFIRGGLWTVNARFDQPVTPTTAYWLTRLHR
jgi:outer membrane protein assembly factor BamB